MRKFIVFMVALFVGMFAFGQSVAFSGNVYTGLRADISNGSGTIYANEDANGTPIWTNFRADYSLDSNAGLVLNFRIKGTDVNSKNQSTFYPFLNRGYVWAKSVDGTMRVRSGYLWDSDFESSWNAWDTNSNYEWVTELAFFPVKNVELGATLPTPYNKMDLVDSFKDTTFGIVFSPDHFRFSTMAQYGSTIANRSMNFGVDFTGIDKFLLRFEGNLQQVGITNQGFNQLYQQIDFNFGLISPDLQVMEVFSKAPGVDPTVTFTPNATIDYNGITYYGQYAYSFISNNVSQASNQIKVYAQIPLNKKAWYQLGGYVAKSNPNIDVVYSPFVQFFAAF